MWSNTTIDAVPVFAAAAKLGAAFAPANALLGVEEAVDAGLAAVPGRLPQSSFRCCNETTFL